MRARMLFHWPGGEAFRISERYSGKRAANACRFSSVETMTQSRSMSDWWMSRTTSSGLSAVHLTCPDQTRAPVIGSTAIGSPPQWSQRV